MEIRQPINANDTQALYASSRRLQDYKTQDPQEGLKKAATELESFFLQMVMKSMRDANKAFESSLEDSHARDTFQEMHDKQLSLNLSKQGGVGLASLIVRQMSKNLPDSQAKPHTVATMQPPAGIMKPASLPPTPSQSEPKPNTSLNLNGPVNFVQSLWQHAKRAAEGLKGLDYKILLAQAALETGWGASLKAGPGESPNFNLFGIKADKSWQGPSKTSSTLEFVEGTFKPQKEQFRFYEDVAQSFDDYVDFLKTNPRYEHALSASHDPHKFVQHLSQAGYATDPGYAQKIMQVYHSPTLNAALKLLG